MVTLLVQRKFIFLSLILFFIRISFVQAVPAPDSPIVKDWLLQDGRTEVDAAVDVAYLDTCQKRRDSRLKTLKETYPKIVFTKHYNLGGSHYAYTEGQSDAQQERSFHPGSALCLLELGADDEYHVKTLLEDPNGVIRDPAVTFDAKKILFAWKKSDRDDDYHLYDYDVESGAVRQLTSEPGVADYEPCPLPNGDVVFNSTRCVQTVDCYWTEVSNLYRCDKDGRFPHRLSFDQVHTNYPSMMDDGRVVYTRWDYNDRGHLFTQALFQMNADGTAQTEYYGNNSWFPTSLLQARCIPGTGGKSVFILSGHHTRQYGKLGIVDPSKGRQENLGVQLIAPIRETRADRIDAWGQWGDRFSHPYPINEHEFIVSYNCEHPEPEKPIRTDEERVLYGNQHNILTPFSLYWFNEDGERELLAWDRKISCNQPFPLVARKPVPIRDTVPAVSENADDEYGVYTVQNVYFGPGLEGVERGAAKTLRVIALEFRSVGIGENQNGGPGGGATVSTPVSIAQGTWDVKVPLGDVPIEEDGSASFMVPARTPVYFQILDDNGHCIQTMRSWSTLQPGETFSCIGCHEDKNSTAQIRKMAIAQQKPPRKLKPFYGPPRGFSFAKEIQPILDKHCVQCHDDTGKEPPFRKSHLVEILKPQYAVSPDLAERIAGNPILKTGEPWHFTTEKPTSENWFNPQYFQDVAAKFPLSAGPFGSAPGPGPKTDWTTSDLWVWRNVELPETWQNQPLLLQLHHDENVELYVNGKRVFSEIGHNSNYSYSYLTARQAEAFAPGVNYLAAHIQNTVGGQGFDLGIRQVNPGIPFFVRNNRLNMPEGAKDAFSLKGDPVFDMRAKRNWSRAYLNLTNSNQENSEKAYHARPTPVVNWISVQGAPPMLAPYRGGAACSELMKMIDPNLSLDGKTHNDVRLSREEIDKIAAWIDLLVPFCGDYFEANAWNDEEKQKFEYYETKRRKLRELDRINLLRFASRHSLCPASEREPKSERTDANGEKERHDFPK